MLPPAPPKGGVKTQEQGTLPSLSAASEATLPPTLEGAAHFRFLHQAKDFGQPDAIDWNYPAFGKLWTYHLNYFEYLRQPGLDPALGYALVEAWMAAEATHRDGWEPYPISLRLVNWLHFYGRQGHRCLPPSVHTSVARQYFTLLRKVEYHLGGNHLLENALALSLTSRYLNDGPGRQRADNLLRAELREQYYPDGGHYELSVMYHLILLWRQLDVYAFLPPGDQLRVTLHTTLEKQLAWLLAMLSPSAHYPHFNDSSPGVAPPPQQVLAYARQLGFSPAAGILKDSGYRRWRTDRLDVWIDAAAIGPDHQPGHAHADNLTFVVHLDGQPVIVDAGSGTYEKDARRAWERSTAAHNTVVVDGKNSSDVWGGFRVGRRARTTLVAESMDTLSARHGGYPGHHRRTFQLVEGGLQIHDELRPRTSATAYLHFQAGLAVELRPGNALVGGLSLHWPANPARLTDYQQALSWNRWQAAQCLEIDFTGSLTLNIHPTT
ncbi:alginate lyase family protein [Neolewinella lacunae]|uniref:Alginate lyase family protein n=1 Tax=Neolewinella lacunae TaxID=1517758 RepID=A0A923PM00_9BACT|nr:heparinase II/III family protein [Neolewinella lacunae]MBC6994141.1 alginate lyase family protein [Neolewinella lacunae]MDN3636710.1 alginate lyase family protein [Neolewinella lacunae]